MTINEKYAIINQACQIASLVEETRSKTPIEAAKDVIEIARELIFYYDDPIERLMNRKAEIDSEKG